MAFYRIAAASALLLAPSVAATSKAAAPSEQSEEAARAMLGSEAGGQGRREVVFEGDLPASGATPPPQAELTSLDSPNVLCYQPDPRQDACFVNWGYTWVNAAPNYMTAMWIRLNGKVVARMGGFFQTSMYVSSENLGRGFRVACGPPGDDPADPAPTARRQVGNQYSWDIKAVDSATVARSGAPPTSALTARLRSRSSRARSSSLRAPTPRRRRSSASETRRPPTCRGISRLRARPGAPTAAFRGFT
jgi:hypothetical protein